jgi:hypothetical protein
MGRISEIGTTLAATSNCSTLRRNANYMEGISELGTMFAITSKLNHSQLLLMLFLACLFFSLMMEAIPPPNGVIFQKTAFLKNICHHRVCVCVCVCGGNRVLLTGYLTVTCCTGSTDWPGLATFAYRLNRRLCQVTNDLWNGVTWPEGRTSERSVHVERKH